MSEYLMIASRDASESGDVHHYYGLASDLVAEGHSVTLFLVQNGVMPARFGAKAGELTAAIESGVSVLADDFALRERGIPVDRLISGVEPTTLETVVDRMADGCKAMWH